MNCRYYEFFDSTVKWLFIPIKIPFCCCIFNSVYILCIWMHCCVICSMIFMSNSNPKSMSHWPKLEEVKKIVVDFPADWELFLWAIEKSKDEDYTMVILFRFTCSLHVIQLYLAFLYPIGFLYSNKGCNVLIGCTCDLTNGSCRTN